MVKRVTALVLSLSLAVTVSCGSQELPISGRVLIDGQPMESGTLHLDPVDAGMGKAAGGSVKDGVLQLSPGHGLVSGKYRVSATAFRKTGRTINDYQRGKVEETVQLQLKDSPQEIELSHDTASRLTIDFSTIAKR